MVIRHRALPDDDPRREAALDLKLCCVTIKLMPQSVPHDKASRIKNREIRISLYDLHPVFPKKIAMNEQRPRDWPPHCFFEEVRIHGSIDLAPELRIIAFTASPHGMMTAVKDFLQLRRVFVTILFIGTFTLATRNVIDPDVWWHLKTGEYIAVHKSIPHVDIFSFTRAGQPWIAHEWLSDVLLYGIYRAASWGGLIAVFAAVVS